MSEDARRDAFEDEVRTALFRPGGELKRVEYRLMGFTIGIALLVVLAPTWLNTRSENGRMIRIYSGMSMIGLTPGSESPMGALGTILLLAYVLLAVILLAVPPDLLAALIVGIAGAAVTLAIVVNQPADSGGRTADWTGAPAVAVGLWVAAVIVAGVAHNAARD